ncbi:MAG: HAD family hydrolase [Bacilli bacterium]
MIKKPIVAIMYDFDKTLCTEDEQNYKFIPDVSMTPDEFWAKTGLFSKKADMERILSYMYMMIIEAQRHGFSITKNYLNDLGKSVVYQKGLTAWFKRINEYGERHGVKVEHYIISSGLVDIINGTSISKEFKGIYACEFLYDEKTGAAIWPKLTINYTLKTQYIFRISKGVTKLEDDDAVNERVSKENRRVLYKDMIYIGDGITDIPCMQLVKDKGGLSIAIYGEKYAANAAKLDNAERVTHICKADYGVNSTLDEIVKLRIKEVAIRHRLAMKSKNQSKLVEEYENVQKGE